MLDDTNIINVNRYALFKKNIYKWKSKYFSVCSGLFELGLIVKVSSSCFVAVGLFFKWGKKYFILKQITALCSTHEPGFAAFVHATQNHSYPEMSARAPIDFNGALGII